MGQRKGNKDIFSKWKGIVTEQNIGQFEAEAAIDADNVEFLKDGTVQRRLGFEQETGGGILETMTAAERSGSAFSHFLWEDINGIPGLNIRAIQLGSAIKLLDDTYPVSQATLLGTINLDTFAAGSIVRTETNVCQYAAGAGIMVIVARGIEPIRVTVESKEWPPIPTIQQQEVLIRWDKLEGDVSVHAEGPVNLTHAQEFDLRNSGWPFFADCSAHKDGRYATVIVTDPAAFFRAKRGRWPKVSILYSAMRLSNTTEPAVIGSFSPWEVAKLSFGNTIPPKGHYITPAWNFDSRSLMLADIIGDAEDLQPADSISLQVESRSEAVYLSSSTDSYKTSGSLVPSGGISGVVTAVSDTAPTVQFSARGLGDSTLPGTGQFRIQWAAGDNTSSTFYVVDINGAADMVLLSKTPNPIQVGDTFLLI